MPRKKLHPEPHQKVGEKGMSFEEAPVETNPQGLQYDDLEVDHEFPAQKQTPQCYGGLTLDHVVCASVVAEVKEPQAVRALDVHPNGTHLAVGTNARALRVFDLSTPLQQRQQQLSWSSPLNLILPLLPVALEAQAPRFGYLLRELQSLFPPQCWRCFDDRIRRS